jgi:hypothetical protein
MARRSLGSRVVTFVILVVLATGLVWVGLTMFARTTDPPMCVVTSPDGSFSLDLDQADNAGLIAAIALTRDLPEQAITVALATALQESKLRNLDYGHADSLGLFQQRPSMGWGTPEEILNPIYSTNTFFDVLIEVDDWQNLPVTVAAQAVQRSAFPDAYAQHEQRAALFAAAFVGSLPGGLVCQFTASAGDGTLDPLLRRVEQDWAGFVVATPTSDTTATLTAPAIPLWAVGSWAVAVAQSTGVNSVTVGDLQWRPSWREWRPATAAPDGVVSVSVGRP